MAWFYVMSPAGGCFFFYWGGVRRGFCWMPSSERIEEKSGEGDSTISGAEAERTILESKEFSEVYQETEAIS